MQAIIVRKRSLHAIAARWTDAVLVVVVCTFLFLMFRLLWRLLIYGMVPGAELSAYDFALPVVCLVVAVALSTVNDRFFQGD